MARVSCCDIDYSYAGKKFMAVQEKKVMCL